MSDSAGRHLRGFASWILPVAFALLALVSATGATVGSWAHSVLFDTETWTEVVGPVGTDETVRTAVADAITEEVNGFLRPGERLQNLLPDRLDPLGGILGKAIEGVVEDEVVEFVFSDRYEQIWLSLNESAHRAIVAAIRDELPFVSTAEGVVSVDLRPVIEPIVDRVIVGIERIGGWIPDLVLDVAEVDDAIRELISQYETEGLPESLGEVVVYESETFAALQDTVEAFDRLVFVLPVVAAVFVVFALWLAPSRAGMVVGLGVGGMLTWFSTMLITDRILVAIVNGLSVSPAQEVAQALLGGATQTLYDLLRLLTAVALLVGAVGAVRVIVNRRRGRDEAAA